MKKYTGEVDDVGDIAKNDNIAMQKMHENCKNSENSHFSQSKNDMTQMAKMAKVLPKLPLLPEQIFRKQKLNKVDRCKQLF